MNDAPERIWAIKLRGAKAAVFLGGETSPPFEATEYRRADLPPTLAEALAVPDVRALVDALVTGDTSKADRRAILEAFKAHARMLDGGTKQ